MPRALPEEDLHVFLRRRRMNDGEVEPPPLGSFLAETLSLAARLVPSRAGSLLLDDPTADRTRSPLTFVAAFGPTADGLMGTRVPSGEGVVGHVYRTGQTYATRDPHRDPHFFPVVDRTGGYRTRSVLATPVRLEQTVCGVFELVNRRGRHSFSDRDVELVELIAEYVSRAILNAVDVLKQNELARRDDLTGLYNVRMLDPTLSREIASARRHGHDLAVLFVDVDRLKRLNDRMGHHAGSEALRRIGRAVGEAVGDRGLVFRFGGDELVVVAPRSGMEGGEALADDIRSAVAEHSAGPMPHGGRLPSLSVSVGVATLLRSLGTREGRGGPPQGARLLLAADRALYRAKNAGRDRSARATRRDDRLGR